MQERLVWLAAGLAAACLIAAGCKSKKEETGGAKDEKTAAQPRPEKKGEGPATDRPRPADKDSRPAQGPARPVPFAAKDGSITVIRPGGPQWDCMDRQAKRGTQTVSMIRCRPTDRAQFFFMIAKVYTVPKKDVMDAKKLATVEFAGHYKKFFQSHKIVKSGPIEHQNHKGFEIHLEARHASRGDVKKVERVVVKDTSVVILSAEGAPGPFDKNEQVIKAWVDGAKFQILGK